MAQFPRRHSIWSNATLTTAASPNTVGPLQNLGRQLNPVVIATLDVQAAPSGSSPNLLVTVYAWTSANRRVQVGQFTAVTGILSTPQRITIQNVLEENLEVEAVVTGSGASFTQVYCDLLMSSPDA